MIRANIADIKDHFTEYLRKVARGDEVGVCRRNVLIARLSTAGQKKPRNATRLGCGKGTARANGDLTEPFMPANDWSMLGESEIP